MINYSIIIPHKNSQELLAYGLSTIPVRDDVQVIVVDDNSDPQKVDFENFPQWGGCHYEYYLTKEGEGAGYARNVGLDHAKGKWVLFVDADDYVLPTINKIFDECVNSEADIIYFRPKAVVLGDKDAISRRADRYHDMVNHYLTNHDETKLRVRFLSPCSKIVRRQLIEENHIRFEEIRYSNDNYFSVQIGCYARQIEVKDDIFYVITESGESLTSNFCEKEGERIIRTEALFRSTEFIRKYGYEPDWNYVSRLISPFLFNDRKRYRYYIKAFMNLGYTKRYITRQIFNSPKWKARTWRRVYSYCVTIMV